MGETIFHFKDAEKPIVVFEHCHLPHMVVGMMSSVIEWVEHQEINQLNDYTDRDLSHCMRPAHEEIERWADHGFVNAALFQAQFVFDFFEEATKDGVMVIFGDRGVFKLFIRMTESIQRWRDIIRARDRKVHGEHWGTAMGFYSFDWCRLNEHIRTKYKIPKEK